MQTLRAVLDASTVLMIFNNEPGANAVLPYIEGAAISAVNLAELETKFDEWAVPIDERRAFLGNLQLTVVPFDADLAIATGRLRAATRHFGISLGDRACLATAQSLGLPAVTVDRKWAELDLGIEIRPLR